MQNTNPTGLDAYKPSQLTELVEQAGLAKAKLPFVQLFTLAVLAGCFISLGGAAYTMVMTGADVSFGPIRFVGGIVFSVGLILVIVGGAELFTGNALMIMAAVDRKITIGQLLKNWIIVYIGNFAGALIVVIAIWPTGLLEGPAGETAAAISTAKSQLSWSQALFRGILCNMFVCLAVWLSLAARSVPGKIMAVIWPISCFVLLGLEHSIANMYLIPQGMIAGAPVGFADFAKNLLFVTVGNVIGGAGGVAGAYRLAYGGRA
jgi:formate/nitrite transporter